MFLRLIADNFTRRPRRKLLTAAALSLGMAVATAALSVSLDVGDRLAKEFRSLGANLVVSPEADSLPLEIGGVDYRPVNAGAYLPESDLPKIKSVFWHNNIIAFAPTLDVPVQTAILRKPRNGALVAAGPATLIGTWFQHAVYLNDSTRFVTGVGETNPWWKVEGRWFSETTEAECVIGVNYARRTGRGVDDEIEVKVPNDDSGHMLTVTGILSTGGPEDDAIVVPLQLAQGLASKPGQYRKLYVSALTKPEDDFARRDPKTMNPDELERWSCSPYVSSIAYSIKQVLPRSDVRVIRRVADGEGKILMRVRILLWLVTFASLLAAALAVGASSAASVIERRGEIGLMKALGAGSSTVGWLLARFLGTKIFGVPPAPSLLVLGIVLVLAAGVTLLGSALPLRRAANYDPAPILRGE